MTQPKYSEVLQQSLSLSKDDQLRLIAKLAGELCDYPEAGVAVARWEDHAGVAPYPLCGEDAQAWISRTRQESDEVRSGS